MEIWNSNPREGRVASATASELEGYIESVPPHSHEHLRKRKSLTADSTARLHVPVYFTFYRSKIRLTQPDWLPLTTSDQRTVYERPPGKAGRGP